MTTVEPDGGGNASNRTGTAAFSPHSDRRKNSVLLTKRPEVACALDTGLGASRPQRTRSSSVTRASCQTRAPASATCRSGRLRCDCRDPFTNKHEAWPRRMGACAPVPPARYRARTAAGGRAPLVDGVTASRRSSHAEQAVAGGAPSGFSRIQIAWCAGCWPTSPRPQGSHLPFHTTAARPSAAGPKVRHCHDLWPMTGASPDADQAILQHAHNGAGMPHRRTPQRRAGPGQQCRRLPVPGGYARQMRPDPAATALPRRSKGLTASWRSGP